MAQELKKSVNIKLRILIINKKLINSFLILYIFHDKLLLILKIHKFKIYIIIYIKYTIYYTKIYIIQCTSYPYR